MKSPPIIISLASLVLGGNLSQYFFVNIPSIILRPYKYDTLSLPSYCMVLETGLKPGLFFSQIQFRSSRLTSSTFQIVNGVTQQIPSPFTSPSKSFSFSQIFSEKKYDGVRLPPGITIQKTS